MKTPAPYNAVCGINADRLFIGLVPAYLSPLDGAYPLPANGVDIAEPKGKLPEHHAWQLNDAGTDWNTVADYRQLTVYDTVTGQPLPPLALGIAPPATATLAEPPWPGEKEARQWNPDSCAWELLPDHRGETYWLANGSQHVITEVGQKPPAHALTEPPPPTAPQIEATARSQRDALLASSEWIILRHRDETEASRATTLTSEHYAELQVWRQALRDWPAQAGWPQLEIPQAPIWISAMAVTVA